MSNLGDEKELEKLLNIKLDKLEKLDILEDDPVMSQDPVPDNDLFKDIPPGKEGFEILSQSPAVNRFEEFLLKTIDETNDMPNGPPFARSITQIAVTERTEVYKNGIQHQYDTSLKKVRDIFLRITSKNPVHNDEIIKVVDDFMSIFIKDKCILLNLVNCKCDPQYELYHHGLHVCLLCINIAAACGYSKEQVLEIGEAGLLADIGMLHIPNDMLKKKVKLKTNELFDIQKHPIIGITLLERVQGIPMSVPLASYQHHERLSGVGYTKNRKAHLIHAYARIVAIADVYHALCCTRAHRRGLLPHEAINRIIKMANFKLLDATIIKSFIKYVSLFPIGSFVNLSDGRVAKTVQSYEDHMNRPLVSILTDFNGTPLPANKIFQVDLSRNYNLKIVGAVDFKGSDEHLMDGF
ncbi:MAG: HD domain-containing protein [Fibrobacteria bacterium]|nr:HD domain-containing protein [Fibrobacteria bacterium]